jgi:hypothetical protein
MTTLGAIQILLRRSRGQDWIVSPSNKSYEICPLRRTVQFGPETAAELS